MKKFHSGISFLICFLICFCSTAVSFAQHDYRWVPVPFTQVEIPDGFWKPRLDSVREESIPFSFKKCEETGRMDNFDIAAGKKEGKFVAPYFNDSDAYKVIEGASYVLMLQKNEKLETYMDTLIERIGAAQEPDGYLYTPRSIYVRAKNKAGHFTPTGREKRWSDHREHELYCLGHLYEAAYAHHLATGKRNLLDIALKSANLVCETFGSGKSQNWPPGHQEIEVGLVKLYRLTGEKKYLDMAKHFLDIRGTNEGRTFKMFGQYSQDHLPVVKQTEAVGHSVRAGYMYCGMADVAALTGDEGYAKAIQAIWHEILETKFYVTGGIGAIPRWEGFGMPYELPNDTAYCETCAQISMIYWAHRMFLDSGKAEYYDVLEKILYNAGISGVNLAGNEFFYPNVLEVRTGGRKRSPWFSCSCCPGSVCRFLPSIPGYIYAVKDDAVYVNLYTNSKASIDAKIGGQDTEIQLTQKTNYPWDGKISVTTQTPGKYTLKFRVPGWTREAMPGKRKLYTFLNPVHAPWTAKVSDGTTEKDLPITPDGYLTVTREWKAGESVELDFPMTVQRVLADPRVPADRGKTAIQRGPIVYCLEQQDSDTKSIFSLVLPDDAAIQEKWEPELLGGVVTLTADVLEFSKLLASDNVSKERPTKVRLIPYYAWAHRDAKQMAVWLARTPEAAAPLCLSELKVPENFKDPHFICDGKVPENPWDQNQDKTHWWPDLGAKVWMEYHFPKEMKVEGVRIYWFDDRSYGHCRLPESWKVLYLNADGKWQEVTNPSGYEKELYQFNETRFDAVTTKALRVEIQSQKEWAGGVNEWEVIQAK